MAYGYGRYSRLIPYDCSPCIPIPYVPSAVVMFQVKGSPSLELGPSGPAIPTHSVRCGCQGEGCATPRIGRQQSPDAAALSPLTPSAVVMFLRKGRHPSDWRQQSPGATHNPHSLCALWLLGGGLRDPSNRQAAEPRCCGTIPTYPLQELGFTPSGHCRCHPCYYCCYCG